MELKLSSMAMSLALVIIISWAWSILNWVWFTPKKLEKCLRGHGFKGNSYRIWHGDLKDITKMAGQALSRNLTLSDDIVPRLLPFHHHTIQKYGKNSFIWNGPELRVMIMDPAKIREILNKYTVYQKPFSHPLAKLIVSGTVSLEGEQWARHRKLIKPAFSSDKLKLMFPATYTSCHDNVISKWKMLVPTEGSCEVDVWPYIVNLAADVISRTAFGSSYEEGSKIFELQNEQIKLTFQMLRSTYIPGWRFLPTKMNKKMTSIQKEMHARLRGIINQRQQTKIKNDDLLGILLESSEYDIQEQEGKKSLGITIQDVIDECKLFYIAGTKTSANLLVWTMIMLGKHQNWQARAREEVFEAFGSSTPDFQGLNGLKIVTMILNEVLRLYPPSTMLIRVNREKTKLKDMTLPSGVQLMLPILLVHRDKEIWGQDAEEFKPERFSEGVSKATNNIASFFPFSTGPRVCIAQHFAIMEVKLAIAMILQRFSFELSPSYKHAPFVILSLEPQYGAPLILRKI